MNDPTQPNDPLPVYLVRLQAQVSEVPPACRLRRGLKVLLRSFGLRCLAVQEVGPAKPDTPGTPAR
jgi:hypothetical protein